MSLLRSLIIGALIVATPAFAQNAQKQGVGNRNVNAGTRAPVATQPSNNPFQNPIGQGVPPAASTNPALNSNRTNVPR
jgi:hypothetical protein